MMLLATGFFVGLAMGILMGHNLAFMQWQRCLSKVASPISQENEPPAAVLLDPSRPTEKKSLTPPASNLGQRGPSRKETHA